MSEIFAANPEPPYVAVIFTSRRSGDDAGYPEMALAMAELAARQPGYLGMESTGGGEVGITVSYWTDQDAARRWKQVAAHLGAQRLGRERWYDDYRVRVATVEREYSMASSSFDAGH